MIKMVWVFVVCCLCFGNLAAQREQGKKNRIGRLVQPVFNVEHSTATYSVLLPQKAIKAELDYSIEEKFESPSQYLAIDEASASEYFVQELSLNPFLYFEDTLAFLKSIHARWCWLDSLTQEHFIHYQGHYCLEMTCHEFDTDWNIRNRIILTHNNLYVLTARISVGFPVNTDGFFDSFKILQKEKIGLSHDLQLKKTMKAIFSDDRATRDKALSALDYYRIPPESADTLLAYFYEKKLDERGQAHLVEAIAKVRADWVTQKFSNYLDKESLDDTTKCFLLWGLCKQDRADAYRRVIKCLNAGFPDSSVHFLKSRYVQPTFWESFRIRFDTKDSSVMREIYPELLDLAVNNPLWGYTAIDAMMYFADSSYSLYAQFEKDAPAFNKLLQQKVQSLLTTEHGYNRQREEQANWDMVLRLLNFKHFLKPQKEDLVSVKELFRAEIPTYMVLSGFELLFLKFNYISQEAIELLSKDECILDAYRLLEEHHQEDSLPKQYLNQAYLVKKMLLYGVSHVGAEMDSIVLTQVDVRHLEYKGKMVRNYFFTARYYDSYEGKEEEEYEGAVLYIVGPEPDSDDEFEHQYFIRRTYFTEKKLRKAFLDKSYKDFLEELKTAVMEENSGYYEGD